MLAQNKNNNHNLGSIFNVSGTLGKCFPIYILLTLRTWLWSAYVIIPMLRTEFQEGWVACLRTYQEFLEVPAVCLRAYHQSAPKLNFSCIWLKLCLIITLNGFLGLAPGLNGLKRREERIEGPHGLRWGVLPELYCSLALAPPTPQGRMAGTGLCSPQSHAGTCRCSTWIAIPCPPIPFAPSIGPLIMSWMALKGLVCHQFKWTQGINRCLRCPMSWGSDSLLFSGQKGKRFF